MHRLHRLLIVLVAATLGACGGGGGGSTTPATSTTTPTGPSNGGFVTTPGLSASAGLGQLIFADPSLSANNTSCISCHDATASMSLSGPSPVALGGAGSNLPGLRNPPSMMYAIYLPPFTISGAAQGPGQPAVPAGIPVGGVFLDGRVDTLTEQATIPFLNPFEMAEPDTATLIKALSGRPYAPQFGTQFGSNIFNTPDAALAAVAQTIVKLQQELPDFHSFSSKYDAVQAGTATFSTSEANGLAVFNDPSKGNCAACHTSTAVGGVAPLFTDHSYRAIGVPRNWAIPLNQDATLAANATLFNYVPQNGTALGAAHRYYDMGLCGPLRTDLASNTAMCGMFKVPTLRNVATKQHFFHNGIYNNLCDTINFHLTRDLAPSHWYVQADGVTPDQKYNDLPAAYTSNVQRGTAPFNSSGAPALTAAEVNDVVAFLRTLTDTDLAGVPQPAVTCQAVTQ